MIVIRNVFQLKFGKAREAWQSRRKASPFKSGSWLKRLHVF